MSKTWILKFASNKKPDDIFNLISSGKKTVETRSRNPSDGNKDYVNVQVGDKLLFVSLDSGKRISKSVTFIHVYNTVKEMVNNENEEEILPGVRSKHNLLGIYEEIKEKWGEKYKYELENYGIVAMGFK